MIKEIAPNPDLKKSHKDVALGNFKKACAEFESLFITHLLKSMRSSMAENGFLGNSHESKIIHSMFDENLALGIAKGGGIGIGEMLFERLKARA